MCDESWRVASDERLIMACRQANERAWQALVARYCGLVYSTAVRRGLDHGRAGDLVERVFRRLIDELDDLERPDCVRAWLLAASSTEARQVCEAELPGREAGLASRLERVIGLVRREAETGPTDEPPPPLVVQRASALLRRQRLGVTPRGQAPRPWAAELMFDSASRHLPDHAGARGTPSAWRRLVFAAGPFELDLRLVRSSDPRGEQSPVYAVAGQVLGPCTGSGRVSLSQSSPPTAPLAEVALNEICEFDFRAVPAGSYALVVHLPADSIRVSVLDLGAD